MSKTENQQSLSESIYFGPIILCGLGVLAFFLSWANNSFFTALFFTISFIVVGLIWAIHIAGKKDRDLKRLAVILPLLVFVMLAIVSRTRPANFLIVKIHIPYIAGIIFGTNIVLTLIYWRKREYATE